MSVWGGCEWVLACGGSVVCWEVGGWEQIIIIDDLYKVTNLKLV